MRGEGASHGARLLQAQILGLMLLALVELAQVLLLCLVDDGHHTSNGFAHNAAGKREGGV